MREAHAILISTFLPNILQHGQSIFWHSWLHDLFFFSHSTFSLDLTNMWNPSKWSYQSVSRLCLWERLNNSGFCPITIPMDLISVFEIFLAQGSIELPCLNLLPCQRKIVAVYWPKGKRDIANWIKVHFSLIYRTASAKNGLPFKSPPSGCQGARIKRTVRRARFGCQESQFWCCSRAR